mmetsp:Transcript_11449/g.33753  ORF Transcript_11449/g.33753 Transcript_11449/m.33753 type:complete len:207 (+) Transcript_11449:2433-3053(+)
MQGRHKGCRRDHARGIDDRLLHIALDRSQHGRVNDAGKDTESVGPVQIHVACHIFRQRGRHDNHVVWIARLSHFLDEQVHHPPQARVVAHKKFSHAEKNLGRLSAAHELPRVLQVQKLGDDRAALAGTLPHGLGVVEYPRLLQDSRLLEVRVRGHEHLPVLVLELLREVLHLAKDALHGQGLLPILLLLVIRHGCVYSCCVCFSIP